MTEFAREFSEAWQRLTRRFLKLECWQTYQEQEANKSIHAFMAGNVNAATDLLRKEAAPSQPLYDDIKSRGLDYARIRLVTLPLTPYLEYEMINYKIRHAMGENIEFVLLDPGLTLPNDDLFDFLLFDDKVALVHDYGTDGFQVGGWLVEQFETVRRLQEIAVSIRIKSMSLAEFLRTATV